MKELSKGKTTLLIAHRFSSIRLASRILVMDKGQIVADGQHDELYAKCVLYKNLYDGQQDPGFLVFFPFAAVILSRQKPKELQTVAWGSVGKLLRRP